jgi:nucleotide-binding universal stress UspA family protein
MIALKNVLVATDFGEPAEAAVMYGRALARAFGATLHVLHVVQDVYHASYGSEFYIPEDPDVQHEVNEAVRKQLDTVVREATEDGMTIRSALRMSNAPAPTIVQFAKDQNIDLIVMGTRGRKGVAHLLLGSVAEHVVRTAPCPVLTVHHPEHEFLVSEVPAVVRASA